MQLKITLIAHTGLESTKNDSNIAKSILIWILSRYFGYNSYRRLCSQKMEFVTAQLDLESPK